MLEPIRANPHDDAPLIVGAIYASMRLLLLSLLMLPGCTKNHAELTAMQDQLDRRMAESMAIAVEPVAAPEPVSIPLPPESMFEGSEGARLRLRIVETQRRLAELERILVETRNVSARSRHLQKQLDALTTLKAQRAAPQ